MSEDTQGISQLRSSTFPRHQKKKKTQKKSEEQNYDNDKTNAIYKTIDARTKTAREEQPWNGEQKYYWVA